ncbi:coilin [Scleropages formosus]|uniref:coilin n=1 Tax=Scleropages formosus TaxID=113540 RepID=UPI0010FA6957|nr:coilin [Scleropages formosus]
MALCGPCTVRLRVLFDYPPPALPDCRMCWVLVDLNRCRVVADLASVIRDKLEFSRGTVLNLFMEDCYLPPVESAHVVRDNDTIRVKVDHLLPQENGCASAGETDSGPLRSRKRRREPQEEPLEEEEEKKKRRRKKSKKRQVEEQVEATKKKKKKKKKKQRKRSTEQAAVPEKPASLEKDPTTLGPVPVRMAVARKRVSGSSGTSSGEEEPPRKSALRPGGMAGAPGKQAKPARPAAPRTSDSSSSGSSDTAAPQEGEVLQASRKDPSAAAGSSSAAPAPGPAAAEGKGRGERAESSSSDSGGETELAIKRPDPATAPLRGSGRGAQPPRGVGRGGVAAAAAGRGVGRGNVRAPQNGGGGRGVGRGSRGAGRGAPLHNGPRFPSQNGQRQQRQDDILTNRTVVLQNPPASAPRRDYASLPLLAAPPAVGQRIAFKLLELTENYTPEVSDYKEGKITGFDQTNNQVELELLSSAPAPTEPGKFDLVYQAPDGSEVVEYAVCRGSQLTERWESLLEPRLLLENIT